MIGRRVHEIARWLALLWAVTAVIAVPLLPLYASVHSSLHGEVLSRASLVDVNGAWVVYRILLVPLIAAAVTLLPAPLRVRCIVAVSAAIVAGLAALVSLMTVGMFLVPTAIGLCIAVPGYWQAGTPEANDRESG